MGYDKTSYVLETCGYRNSECPSYCPFRNDSPVMIQSPDEQHPNSRDYFCSELGKTVRITRRVFANQPENYH
jgi:hypothetical protein